MKRFAAVLVLAIALIAAASASAATTGQITNYVKKTYTQEIKAHGAVAGFSVIATTAKCAPEGQGQFTCFVTYTCEFQHAYGKYGIYINAKANGAWRTIGHAITIRVWS